jgi:hypothetical protein
VTITVSRADATMLVAFGRYGPVLESTKRALEVPQTPTGYLISISAEEGALLMQDYARSSQSGRTDSYQLVVDIANGIKASQDRR